MPYYEHVFIARQDLSAQQVDALAEQFASIIKEGGGKVTKTESWGLRPLAYQIKKNRRGHYILLNIDSPYPAVSEMERQLKLNEDVIRHQTIRVDALQDEPSIVMQFSERRDDRGPRGRRDFGDRNDSRPNSRPSARPDSRPESRPESRSEPTEQRPAASDSKPADASPEDASPENASPEDASNVTAAKPTEQGDSSDE